jgi:hypothetical protein
MRVLPLPVVRLKCNTHRQSLPRWFKFSTLALSSAAFLFEDNKVIKNMPH